MADDIAEIPLPLPSMRSLEVRCPACGWPARLKSWTFADRRERPRAGQSYTFTADEFACKRQVCRRPIRVTISVEAI